MDDPDRAAIRSERRRRCEGNPIRSIAWGTVWETIYTAPIAAFVWFIHFAAARVAM